MATERFIAFEARYEGERALEAVTHMLGHTWGSAHANTLTTATARSQTYDERWRRTARPTGRCGFFPPTAAPEPLS